MFHSLKCGSCGARFDRAKIMLIDGVASCPLCGTVISSPNQISKLRRRGTAIVENSRGILVISGRMQLFLLPGGGAYIHETRMNAAVRELKEETGLEAKNCRYLFSYDDPNDGRKVRNLHKVFLIETHGRPHHKSSESRHIAYWNRDSNLTLSRSTRAIAERYLTMKSSIGTSTNRVGEVTLSL
jgi:8-oxo-dGTP diphosphatase